MWQEAFKVLEKEKLFNEALSRDQKIEALLHFWNEFHPLTRKNIIKENEPKFADSYSGIIYMLLRGLNEIEPKE